MSAAEENYMKLILWSNDNDPTKVWANGKYIGTMDDPHQIFPKFAEFCKDEFEKDNNLTWMQIIDIDIYDEDILELEEDSQYIYDWFDTVKNMTEEEVNTICKKDYKALLQLLFTKWNLNKI